MRAYTDMIFFFFRFFFIVRSRSDEKAQCERGRGKKQHNMANAHTAEREAHKLCISNQSIKSQADIVFNVESLW